jgi:hypothetical protein
MILGKPIYFSDACLEKSEFPAREYKRKRWQSQRKAALVQKKWTKRFGYKMKPCIFKTPNGFIAHPSFKEKLQAAIQVTHNHPWIGL